MSDIAFSRYGPHKYDYTTEANCFSCSYHMPITGMFEWHIALQESGSRWILNGEIVHECGTMELIVDVPEEIIQYVTDSLLRIYHDS